MKLTTTHTEVPKINKIQQYLSLQPSPTHIREASSRDIKFRNESNIKIRLIEEKLNNQLEYSAKTSMNFDHSNKSFNFNFMANNIFSEKQNSDNQSLSIPNFKN